MLPRRGTWRRKPERKEEGALEKKSRAKPLSSEWHIQDSQGQNQAHIRQSRPESGLGFQVNVLKNVMNCSIFARKQPNEKSRAERGGGAGEETQSGTTWWTARVSGPPNFGGNVTKFAPYEDLNLIA